MCLFHVCLLSRCFGLLLSPGKNVKNSDMHLLDLVGDCLHVCVCVCLRVCLCLLTPLNLCPFRNQWEKAQTGSLTSSQEVGTPTRLNSRLWMRKRPKVTAKNLSESLIKQSDFHRLVLPWFIFHLLVGCFFNSYFHTSIWQTSKLKNCFLVGAQNFSSNCKGTIYGKITATLSRHWNFALLWKQQYMNS